ILKQSFAPQADQEETKQSYLDSIYVKLSDNSTDNSSSSISDNDNTPSDGAYKKTTQTNKLNIVENLSAVNLNEGEEIKEGCEKI
ncbi:5326_t:CDS:2, partial [Dentiscutata heterogama]